MDIFTTIAKVPVFSVQDLVDLYGNVSSTYSSLSRLMSKDRVRKIRRNMYSMVDPGTGLLVANRFQIACAISETAYLSHHSAFEYYGLTNQVYNELYVSSESKFTSFTYDDITYTYVASRMKSGVINAKTTRGVRLTDLERTVIDSILDVNKIAGIDELLNCLSGIIYLDEDMLKDYLATYDSQVLYQKTGFLLEQFAPELKISTDFINLCKSKICKSIRCLDDDRREDNYYRSDWQLMVPRGLFAYALEENLLV